MANTLAPEEVLLLDDVAIYYGDTPVLTGVTFRIRRNEFVYLVGRTGSGKSSLMKLLYADLQPKRGEIWVEKYNLAEIAKKDKPFLRRRIGVVFQDFQLFGDRTIADNLDFVLRATGWRDASQRKARITDVLMLVGLSSKMNAMPHQLSGGEQQRTAIARALLNDPALLIADEPTGNLDPEVTDHIMELLNRVNRTGTAVLMATHEHDLIRRFPARVLECAEGRVLDHGTPQLQGHVIPNP